MGENICKSYIDKKLISAVHKELKLLNDKEKKNPIKKRAKDLNKFLSKEDMQMANRYLKICSSLIIKEMQNKTTLIYHLIQVRTFILKR
jgi:hypothetical protein